MNLISTRYAFTSAYLKGEEARGITAHHVEKMLQRSTIQDALEAIRNTDIGGYLWQQPVKTFDDADEYLWRYQGVCLERLERFKPPSDIVRLVDVYIKKYDILNTKIALRRVLTGETAPMAQLGVIYDQKFLEKLSNTKNVEEIAEVLVKCNLDDYASIVGDIKEKDVRSTFEGEIKLDKIYYESMLNALKKMADWRSLARAFGIIIDLKNLQIVLRSVIGEKESTAGESVIEGGYMLSGDAIKKLLSLKMTEVTGRLEHTEYHQTVQEISKSYEEEGNITIVDKVIEKHKFQLLKELLSPRILSPSNMLWYLILKELEIRNIRLILKALADGIPAPEIKGYLVTGS